MRDKVADAICQRRYGESIDDEVYISPKEREGCYNLADAAIAVVIEECAKVADDCVLQGTVAACNIGTAIRALSQESAND